MGPAGGAFDEWRLRQQARSSWVLEHHLSSQAPWDVFAVPASLLELNLSEQVHT